jgi:hypothetical protein
MPDPTSARAKPTTLHPAVFRHRYPAWYETESSVENSSSLRLEFSNIPPLRCKIDVVSNLIHAICEKGDASEFARLQIGVIAEIPTPAAPAVSQVPHPAPSPKGCSEFWKVSQADEGKFLNESDSR